MIPPGHFSIGMVFGFIILLIFIKFKIVSRKVLLYAPFIMTACGFFALIPDFPLWYQGLGELDHENTHTPISNVFFSMSLSISLAPITEITPLKSFLISKFILYSLHNFFKCYFYTLTYQC